MAYTLVTGGSGFMGQHLVRQLQARGDTVGVIDLQLPVERVPGVEYHQISILDRAQLRYLFPGTEHLYHLAANSHLWANSEKAYTEPNVEGTRVVMETAIEYGVRRIVHTSTESILAPYREPQRAPINENTPLPAFHQMPGPYTRSKWEAERYVRKLCEAGHPINIVYPTTPLGPGDYQYTAPTRMIRGYLRGTPAYYETTLNYIDVRDLAQGMVRTLERSQPGERFILGHKNVNMSTLLRKLQEVSGKKMPRRRVPYLLANLAGRVSSFLAGTLYSRPPQAPLEGVRISRYGLRFDSSKAEQQLGLQCRPIRESLSDAFTWLQREGQL